MDFLPRRDHKCNAISGAISADESKREASINDNELPSPPSRLISSMQKVPSMSDLSEESSLGESIIIIALLFLFLLTLNHLSQFIPHLLAIY